MERPNDRRAFVHKFIGKVIGKVARPALGLLPGGGIIGGAIDIGRGIIGGIGGRGGGGGGGIPDRSGGDPGCPAPQFFRDAFDNCLVVPDAPLGFGGNGNCNPGETSECCRLRTGSTADQAQWQRFCGTAGQQQFGSAVMGQYGAALEPALRQSSTRICPRGAVLGTDGLCYNRRDLKNSERAWPRGRRPLLTGGEMRCISVASSAANKLQRKQKQLQDMGMLPKPTRRTAKALPSGHHAHVAHN